MSLMKNESGGYLITKFATTTQKIWLVSTKRGSWNGRLVL